MREPVLAWRHGTLQPHDLRTATRTLTTIRWSLFCSVRFIPVAAFRGEPSAYQNWCSLITFDCESCVCVCACHGRSARASDTLRRALGPRDAVAVGRSSSDTHSRPSNWSMPSIHASSSRCAHSSKWASNHFTTDITTYGRVFRLSVPAAHTITSWPPPLLIFFHGWGGTLASGDFVHAHGGLNGYVVASPLGHDDNGTKPASWNGGGTTAANTCSDSSGAFRNLCYKSCGGDCTDCSWTTCEDGIAQTRELLNAVDRLACFDHESVFASGVSNGGMFLYELAASEIAHKFAAFMPIVASPHRGFTIPTSPAVRPVPFMGLWGLHDDTIPPIANPHVRGHTGEAGVALDTRWGGWYWQTADFITQQWARANGCDHSNTTDTNASRCEGEACVVAAAAGARCVGWTAGCRRGAQVLRCYHQGGHEVPLWSASWLWAFMREHMRKPMRV